MIAEVAIKKVKQVIIKYQIKWTKESWQHAKSFLESKPLRLNVSLK